MKKINELVTKIGPSHLKFWRYALKFSLHRCMLRNSQIKLTFRLTTRLAVLDFSNLQTPGLQELTATPYFSIVSAISLEDRHFTSDRFR